MSIKTFHIIFIIIATLMCIGVAVWGFFFGRGETVALAIGAVCAMAAVALPIYGFSFYKKAKNIIT